MTMTSDLGYLTADCPGLGGFIKLRAEDFVVEEQPLYEAEGVGEHLMLFVEKRGLTTTDMVRRLAKLFKVRRSDIGYAGLKDKHAVARQHLTVHLPDDQNDQVFLSRIQFTPIKLLWARRHRNKLRRGHHGGNRFVIKIRDARAERLADARAAMEILVRRGAPNFIGDQRFGYRQTNHVLGLCLLKERWKELLDIMLGNGRDIDTPSMRARFDAYDRGAFGDALSMWPRHLRHDRQALDALRQGKSARQAVMMIEQHQRDFLISSVQSAIFNDVLNRRLCEPGSPGLGRLIEGDLAWKHDNRAVFAVDRETAARENAPSGRVPALEVSPSGPMWGWDMTLPKGQPCQWETEALARFGLTREDLGQGRTGVSGSRRSLRMVIKAPDLDAGTDEHGPFVRVSFELQRGSFATVVLRELMKPCRTRGRSDKLPACQRSP